MYDVACRAQTVGMRVQFHRSDRDGGAYVVLIQREDGLTVQLPGYDQDAAVPHHLAHFVTEHEFGLTHGVFGCIAAGAMFSNMTLVGTRPRYETQTRSRAVLRGYAGELGLAESLSGVVHEAVEQHLDLGTGYRRLRAAWGALRPTPCPFGPADLNHVLGLLDQLGRRWHALGPGEVLALRWQGNRPRNAGPVPAPRNAAPARRFSLSGDRPDGAAPE
jgi:hypothetical protein